MPRARSLSPLLPLLALACGSPSKSTSAAEAEKSCGTQLFCDDFEAPALDAAPAAPWTVNAGAGASVRVTAEQAATGEQALRIDAPSKVPAFLELSGGPTFPLPQNSLFGRARFYFESFPSTEMHWTFIAASGTRSDDQHRAEYRYGGQKPLLEAGSFAGSQLMANYETPDFYAGNAPGSDCWHHSSGRALPTQRWVCVEWQFDGPTNSMRLWIDGAAAQDLTVEGTGDGCVHQPTSYVWTAPTFEKVSLGWQGYQDDEPRTVYVDDVALAQERIGCD